MRSRIIVHERIGRWVLQVRPRAGGWGFECVETRRPEQAAWRARGHACPIALVDLGKTPGDGLAAVHALARAAPRGLILVLDPLRHEGIDPVCRALGASHVLSGPVVPPVVVDRLERWVELARSRSTLDGWGVGLEIELDPWSAELGFPLGLPPDYTGGAT